MVLALLFALQFSSSSAQLVQANIESFFLTGAVSILRQDGAPLFRVLSHNLTDPRFVSTSNEAQLIVEQFDKTCTVLAAATPLQNQQPRELSFSTMVLLPGNINLRTWSHSRCTRDAFCYVYAACSGWVNTMQAYANVLTVDAVNETSLWPKQPCPDCTNCSQWLLDELAAGNASSSAWVLDQYAKARQQYYVQLAELLHWQQQTVLDHPLIGLSWALSITFLLSLVFTGNWFAGNDARTHTTTEELDSYQQTLLHSSQSPASVKDEPEEFNQRTTQCLLDGRKRCSTWCHPVIGLLSLLLFVERLASSLLTIDLFAMWTLVGLSGLIWLPVYSLLIRNNPRLVYCCCFCCCWDKLHPENLWPPTRNNCKELFTIPVRGLRNFPLVVFIILDVAAAIAYLYTLREAVVQPVFT